MPKISVCVATHNGEKYIREQIDSILPQLGPHDEIIVSDDGSEDTTISILLSYRDKRLKLVDCASKNSPIKNFENALNHCTGDIIFLSDQDDLWLAGKVKTMIQALEKYDLVLSDCYVVNEKLQPIHSSLFEINKARPGLWKNLWKNSYTGCCMAFNRKVLSKALPFPSDIPMHDQWIGLVAELFFKTSIVQKKLTLYRRHNNTTTRTGDKSNYGLLSKIKFRFKLLKNLIHLYP
ncbi:glycosyltransferase family 2 protein [Fulvivirga kasyanovii]|uniref:Glycosyltransferase family 2 protein n=1 Tax=Fulvivirga kasyanovii TaxID=396812 RepID=A0ABW9RMZ9_9BACT|nr:glycosyltransferase family 2 protein [Fulvivirga kasyanovii]MTI24754.1 glycosyltransferase family 2 protein [Fulvivirga kasyanovii]